MGLGGPKKSPHVPTLLPLVAEADPTWTHFSWLSFSKLSVLYTLAEILAMPATLVLDPGTAVNTDDPRFFEATEHFTVNRHSWAVLVRWAFDVLHVRQFSTTTSIRQTNQDMMMMFCTFCPVLRHWERISSLLFANIIQIDLFLISISGLWQQNSLTKQTKTKLHVHTQFLKYFIKLTSTVFLSTQPPSDLLKLLLFLISDQPKRYSNVNTTNTDDSFR